MKKILLASLATGLMMIGLTGMASADTSVDFTTLAQGTPVTNQYEGVTFSLNGGPGPAGAPVTATNFWPQGLTNTTTGDYPTNSQLLITFSAPASNVSFTFDNAGGPNGSFYNAYDSASNLLQTGVLDTSDYQSSFGLVTLSSSNVSEIVLDNNSGGYSSWEFSIGALNFSEAAPVPEPATMLLFGTGIAGLAAVGRRKRS